MKYVCAVPADQKGPSSLVRSQNLRWGSDEFVYGSVLEVIEITVAQIIGLLVLKICALSTVFALGLHTRWKDVTYLLSKPGLLARSCLAMFVLTPLIAVLLVLGGPWCRRR